MSGMADRVGMDDEMRERHAGMALAQVFQIDVIDFSHKTGDFFLVPELFFVAGHFADRDFVFDEHDLALVPAIDRFGLRVEVMFAHAGNDAGCLFKTRRQILDGMSHCRLRREYGNRRHKKRAKDIFLEVHLTSPLD